MQSLTAAVARLDPEGRGLLVKMQAISSSELVLTDETRGRLWSLPFKDKLRVLRTLVLARLHLTISN